MLILYALFTVSDLHQLILPVISYVFMDSRMSILWVCYHKLFMDLSSIDSSIWYLFLHLFLVQALYFCVPFREQLLDYYSNNKNGGDAEDNLLTCLADLFSQVLTVKWMSPILWFCTMHHILCFTNLFLWKMVIIHKVSRLVSKLYIPRPVVAIDLIFVSIQFCFFALGSRHSVRA